MLKILIVDDHAPLLSGVARYIGIHFPEYKIETATSGGECLEKLHEKGADILILDTHLPDSTGYDLCTKILSMKPDIKIIVLTGTLDISDVRKMMYAGASGYIVKTSITDEIVEGIESVMRGEKFISACVREYP
ncbi:MAG TPA: response regulator transcription factor, partial [Bacteroidales bacterium]|nr:response regulator transcription factor [Bacteroidales bacterium]